MRLNINRFLVPAGLFLATVTGGHLAAQAVSGWASAALGCGAPVDIRVKILHSDGGYQVFFKNLGPAPVHFGFYIEGAQAQDAVSTNGRVHLKSGNTVGPLIIRSQPGAHGPIRVQVVEAAVGEADIPAPQSSAS